MQIATEPQRGDTIGRCVAPLGLRSLGEFAYPGLTPWATSYRPFGAKTREEVTHRPRGHAAERAHREESPRPGNQERFRVGVRKIEVVIAVPEPDVFRVGGVDRPRDKPP